MNKNSKLLLAIVTIFLLASLTQVECRRTYSSRTGSSGRGNRGKNQPSGGGIFSSWFGGTKSSSSGSGSVSKPAPSPSKTAASKNWQTATSHAVSQSKPGSSWANPYYKPPGGSMPVPSAPKEASYGWKPATGANTKPVSSYPSSNIASRGYPVQSGVQGSQTAFGGYKPASSVPVSNYQPSQTSYSGYRPASNVPNTHYPSGHQTGAGYGGYHTNYHPSQASHGYQPSHGVPHQPSYHHSGGYPQQSGGFSGYHQPSYSGYSPHSSFGGAVPSYQGTKLFGGNTGHYGYPGSGGWGIDTYGARKSSGSGTGKLLTGLAVGAAGGYLTSSLVNRITNPWKYSGYGYGSGFGYGGLGGYSGYGSGYDLIRSRDESAFERGFERGVQLRQNENNNSSKEAAASPPPEDASTKWIQCVAFDPQTQQTLINPNCSCTVTTSVDERTGQPLSVHHCTTLNGLIMRPIPVHSSRRDLLQPSAIDQLAGVNSPGTVLSGPDQSTGVVDSPGIIPSYGSVYTGEIQYNGGPTIYLPPRTETKVQQTPTETKPESRLRESKPEQSTTGTNSETSTDNLEVTTPEKAAKVESVTVESQSETPPKPEELAGGLQDNRKRSAEFYGQLQKIVNMGNFVGGR